MFQDSTNRKRFISGNLSAGSVSGNVSQTKRFRKRFRNRVWNRVPNVYEKSRAKKIRCLQIVAGKIFPIQEASSAVGGQSGKTPARNQGRVITSDESFTATLGCEGGIQAL